MSPRPSAAAARRASAAERARLAALALPAPPLDPFYESILQRFQPRQVDAARWARDTGPFVRDLMRRSHVRGVATFPQLLSETSLYVDWATSRGTALTLEALLRHDLIEQWVAANSHTGTKTTWSNRRSRLRNLASHVLPGVDAPARGEAFARAAVKPPYTCAEVAAVERLVLNQPGTTTKRQLCAMVGLGLGAGLGAIDLRSLRAHHVTQDSDGNWWVAVQKPRERVVPVRDRYVPFLLRGLEGLAADDLVLGKQETRQNITGGIVASAAIGSTNVEPDQARLRATWILTAMTEPIPLADLLQACGLTSARTLTDLIPYAHDAAYVHELGNGGR